MWHGRGYLLILATLIFSLCQASLIEYTKEIPKCGLGCLLQAIPASVCQTFTNETCICTDPGLLETVTECASKSCGVLDQLKFAKIQEVACDKPQRHRSLVDEIVFSVLDVVTLACIIVRVFVRYHLTTTMEMDDWVVVAMVMVWAVFLALGHYIRVVGLGRDIWDVDPDTVTSVLRATFIDELFYTLVLSLCRIAVVMFLLRVFDVPRFRAIAWAVIGWIVLYAVGVITATIFQCVPIDFNWLGWTGQYPRSYKCIDVNALSFAAAGVGIAQDLAIMVLPLPIIANLNMAFRKRAQTFVMFSLGLLVVITSAIRLRYLVRFEKSDNPTWDNVDAIIWTHAEVSVSVIVACLPTVRAALASLAPRLLGSTAKTPGNSAKTPSSGPSAGGGLEHAVQVAGAQGADEDTNDDDEHKGGDLHHTFYHNNGSSDVILGSDTREVVTKPKPAFPNFSHPPALRPGGTRAKPAGQG
ncbi:CFEM domain-containing protein [Apiospora rasikravindrae]|uniref:CFEM domain-containing protein n=1 Tax=Apiospora rasikravindrae TaxID=990691 RepID=A0ABR1SP66_9PEZI